MTPDQKITMPYLDSEDKHKVDAQQRQALCEQSSLEQTDSSAPGLGDDIPVQKEIFPIVDEAEYAYLHDLFKKAGKLKQVGRKADALAIYQTLTDQLEQDALPSSCIVLAIKSLLEQSVLLREQNEHETALEILEQINIKFGQESSAEARQQLARAKVEKSNALVRLGKNKEAVLNHYQIIQQFSHDSAAEVREQVAIALINQSIALGQLSHSEAPIQIYDKVIEDFGDDPSPIIRRQVAKAMAFKGIRWDQLGNPEAAIETYDRLITEFGDDFETDIREQVIIALSGKLTTLDLLDKHQEQLAICDNIISRFGEDKDKKIRRFLPLALNTAATLRIIQAKQHWSDEALRNQRLEQAASDLQHAIAHYPGQHTALLLCDLSYTKFLLNKQRQAKRHARESIARGGAKLFQTQKVRAANQVRIEPQDTEYEELLSLLFSEKHIPLSIA